MTSNNIKNLIEELNGWIHCMSYNDSYFGEPTGFLKQTVRQLAKAVDAEDNDMPAPNFESDQ